MLHPDKMPRKAVTVRDPFESFAHELADYIRSLGYLKLSRVDRYRIKMMLKLLLKK